MFKLVLGVALVFFVFRKVQSQEEDLLLIEERLVSYQRCQLDSDCSGNSFCYDNDNNKVGRCKCVAGYELLTRNRTYYACLKFANWGEDCVQDNQCADSLGSLSKCDGTCRCADGANRYSDGRCYRSVLLDDFCRTDANCILEDGTYAFCTDGQCACNLGLQPSADKKSCIQARNLGQNCSNNQECSLVEHSVCREVCRCAMGYVVSRNASMCLKAATYFFDSCEENDQCSAFLRDSSCINRNCSCSEGYHGYENRCARSVDIGQPCRGTEECIPTIQHINVADCIEGICQCQAGVVDERMGCKSSSYKLSVNILILGFYIFIYLYKSFF